ncbi:MAG: type VI secretion system ATPase TssH, partial [Janthinobacterium lividum]
MHIDIRTLLARLDPLCKMGMEQAAELCVRQTHYNVEIEHLLLQLLRAGAPELVAILTAFDIGVATVETQLQRTIDGFKRGNGRTPALAPGFVPLFQEAWLLGSMLLGEQQIRAGTLLLALLEVDALRGALLESAPSLLKISRETLRDRLAALTGGAPRPAGGPAGGRGARAPVGAMPAAGDVLGATRSLDQFTVDLTRLAADGLIDPIRGRDAEIRQLVDVLLRRRQNNPLLTGEAGVGKTAVVEGFAQRIADGDVPPALRGVCVRSLDLALLQAGAGVKGEFESRLKGVIAEVKASPVPVILFIDEAHQLIGAGGAEGQGDAANLLKPALARGELRTIAATTWAEYKKYVERDPALARRFQVVKVDEPQEDAAVDMLRGIVEKLARHHGVEVLDEAVRDAVRLSQRYISGRQLPDKAVSVLDTACARVAIGQTGVPERLEAVARDMTVAEGQLRIWRHEAATGRDRAAEIRDMAARLAESRAQYGKLTDKLAAERRVVDELIALRRRIAQRVEAGLDRGADVDTPPPADGPSRNAPDAPNAPEAAAALPDGDDHDEGAAALAARLNRLEKGLEAVRSDDALVPAYVDSAIVASVISGWTGIPVGRMLADELHTVLHLKERLAERVVGQDAALDAIARRVRTSRADLDDPGKPVGVFLLVGPSGVGKTETGVALADALYGGERNLITVNLSEFQEAHSVSGLKGAPPGYVGYGRGGVLTEAVRRRPYSVILLDEMEKAHPDVLEMFFQVFDKGTMEDGEGVPINFRNTLILMTSNAAQEVVTHACRDGRRIAPDALGALLRPALREWFSPAFLGRLVLVPYYPLGDGQIQAIVALKLRKLAARFMRHHRARFTWTDDVARIIAARCTEVDSGARNIDHILTQAILPELSQQVLERIAMADPFDAVTMTLD